MPQRARNTILILGAFLLLINIFVNVLFAADNPKQLVVEMLDRFQEEKSFAAMLDYVHWQTAWANFPAQDKKRMSVNSPEEFRSYFEAFFNDPGEFAKKHMLPNMPKTNSLNAEQQQKRLLEFTSRFEKKQKLMKENIEKTKYSIGKVDQQGDVATVEIVSTLNGKTENQSLPLERINGKWYLPTMKILSQGRS